MEEEDLQEEDDPEVSSHHQLLDAYTEGVTSGIEGESCDGLGSIFDCPVRQPPLLYMLPIDVSS